VRFVQQSDEVSLLTPCFAWILKDANVILQFIAIAQYLYLRPIYLPLDVSDSGVFEEDLVGDWECKVDRSWLKTKVGDERRYNPSCTVDSLSHEFDLVGFPIGEHGD